MCMTGRYCQPPGVAVETDLNTVWEAQSPEQKLRTCWDAGTLQGRFASTSGLHFLICSMGESLTAWPNHGSLSQQQRGSHSLLIPSQRDDLGLPSKTRLVSGQVLVKFQFCTFLQRHSRNATFPPLDSQRQPIPFICSTRAGPTAGRMR